jgi:O-antigen/teichoic acid export membrane protein
MSETVAQPVLERDSEQQTCAILQGNVGRRVFKNSVAQLAGRIAVALVRFVMVATILRTGGRALFANYSIVLGVLSLGEWLVDFGSTDAFTREVCREPQNATRLMRTLAASKLVQFPIALAVMTVALIAFRYPAVVVQAGIVGAFSLFWFSGVLVYRVIFRSNLRVERDVGSEFISTLVMVLLTMLACRRGLGLVAIFWAYFIARIVYFASCCWFGNRYFRISIQGAKPADVAWSLRIAFAIGVAGFLAVGYEAVDVLLLSRFGSVSDIAFYSGAQKLVSPVLLATAAVASTFYPVFASYWPRDKVRFQQTCQRALEVVLVLAGLAVSPLIAGSGFFMRLLGPQLAEGSPALMGLAILCFLKTVTITLGPILYIVFAQRQLLKMVGLALFVKIVLISLLTRRFGYAAVIGTNILLEIVFAGWAVWMIHHFTQWRVRWANPLKICAAIFAAAGTPAALRLGGISGAAAALSIYAVIVLAAGLVRVSEVKGLVSRGPAEA